MESFLLNEFLFSPFLLVSFEVRNCIDDLL